MKCKTRYCKRQAQYNYCNTCKARRWRQKNPERYSYNNLKHNSVRRGIEFSLTFEEFKKFCHETDYLRGAGRTCTSLSIDRIDPNRGYILENLQVLTVSENSKKGRKLLSYDYETKVATVTVVTTTNYEVSDEYPF